MHDKDAKVAALACEIGLARASASERTGVVQRLIELLAQEDWVLREEIEGCLATYFDRARNVIARCLDEIPRSGEDAAAKRQREIILRRVIARAHSGPQSR